MRRELAFALSAALLAAPALAQSEPSRCSMGHYDPPGAPPTPQPLYDSQYDWQHDQEYQALLRLERSCSGCLDELNRLCRGLFDLQNEHQSELLRLETDLLEARGRLREQTINHGLCEIDRIPGLTGRERAKRAVEFLDEVLERPEFQVEPLNAEEREFLERLKAEEP